jgi:hypothetical protein
MKYLVDSDYVADHLGARPAAIQLLSSLAKDDLAIGLITHVEIVAIGRAHAFPPAPNRAGHFRGTRLSALAPVTCVQPPSYLAHERGTTRCGRSSAVPENKAFLLLALSDLGGLLWPVAHLSNLHPVPVITTGPLITTSPPPSVLHAGMVASLAGQAVAEFPSSA